MKPIGLLLCWMVVLGSVAAKPNKNLPRNDENAKSVKPPEVNYSIKRPHISKATKPVYDVAPVAHKVYNHPQIYLQEPEVRYVYPQRDRHYYDYSGGLPYDINQLRDVDQLFDAYLHNYPRLQILRSPGVWMSQPRHLIYSPKVRLVKPPEYPKNEAPSAKADSKPAVVAKGLSHGPHDAMKDAEKLKEETGHRVETAAGLAEEEEKEVGSGKNNKYKYE